MFVSHFTAICYVFSRFIDKHGTHVIVGLKMGGKDTIYVKQQHSSTLQSADLQKKLKDMADKMFIDGSGYKRGSEKSKVKNDGFYSSATLIY